MTCHACKLMKVIEDLGERGMKKVAVVAPSFTADCVETLEDKSHEHAQP